MKFYLFIVINFFLILNNGCLEKGVTISNPKGDCIQELLRFSKIKFETYFDSDTSITCPRFISWERPFRIGDTLCLIVSSEYFKTGNPVIWNKPVEVTVTSMLGDEETYLLKGNFWPCEIRPTDFEIFRSTIFYKTYNQPFKNNGQLEINNEGDTLIANYKSYCTNLFVKDTVYILSQ